MFLWPQVCDEWTVFFSSSSFFVLVVWLPNGQQRSKKNETVSLRLLNELFCMCWIRIQDKRQSKKRNKNNVPARSISTLNMVTKVFFCSFLHNHAAIQNKRANTFTNKLHTIALHSNFVYTCTDATHPTNMERATAFYDGFFTLNKNDRKQANRHQVVSNWPYSFTSNKNRFHRIRRAILHEVWGLSTREYHLCCSNVLLVHYTYCSAFTAQIACEFLIVSFFSMLLRCLAVI